MILSCARALSWLHAATDCIMSYILAVTCKFCMKVCSKMLAHERRLTSAQQSSQRHQGVAPLQQQTASQHATQGGCQDGAHATIGQLQEANQSPKQETEEKGKAIAGEQESSEQAVKADPTDTSKRRSSMPDSDAIEAGQATD